MAAAQAELRAKSRQLDEATRMGEGVLEASSAVSKLETRVRDLALRRHGSDRLTSYVDMHQVRRALGEKKMAYLYDLRGTTRCELIARDGADSHELGDSDHIRRLTRHLISGMRREFVLRSRGRPDRLCHPPTC